MFLFAFLLGIAGWADCSLRPGSAVFGVLQTAAPSGVPSSHRFAGVYVPGSGLYWYCSRRNFIEGIGDTVRSLRDSIRFQDTRALTEDVPKKFMYRIFIVNKLNAIKNAAKRGMVSLKLDGDRLTVTRNSVITKLSKNRY